LPSDKTLVAPRGRFSATTSLARTLAGTASSRSVRWLEDPERPRSRSASRPGGDSRCHRRRLCPTRWSSVATALEVYLLRQVHLTERVEARACEPGYSSWGGSGARRTRSAVQSSRCSTRSMVRPRGSGHTPRARQLGMDGRGPDQTVAIAGTACAESRRMEKMARSNSGAIWGHGGGPVSGRGGPVTSGLRSGR
jgi:hypothetical protein